MQDFDKNVNHAPLSALPPIVYYSTQLGTTSRLVAKVGLPAFRVPINWRPGLDVAKGLDFEAKGPYMLIVPTYRNEIRNSYIPVAVKRFLSHNNNASWLRGTVGTGNKNFGSEFALAGILIAKKYGVPHLMGVELAGQPGDAEKLREYVTQVCI